MTASGTELIALHGFLGLASDWESTGLETEPVDLWVDVGDDIETWAARFNHEVADFIPKENPRPVLLGYSMGGRLAMAAVTRAPHLYSAAIIVSAHPGLSDEAERAQRLANDREWAKRFRTEPWDQLMKAWANQPVLQPAPHAHVHLERDEKDFDRERLATALTNWSLARQPDLRAALHSLKTPLLFVSGERDTKFTETFKSLKLGERQRLEIVREAGHRVPWDQPSVFRAVVRDFLAGV